MIPNVKALKGVATFCQFVWIPAVYGYILQMPMEMNVFMNYEF